jgi:UPF0755 protein
VVLIPEGFPLKFQADYVDKAWPGMGAPYLTAAADPSWSAKYDFLSTRPANANPALEGYLFPDTYLVDPNAGVNGLIAQQLDQFGKVMTPDIRAQIGAAGAARPAESIESIAILASMVERGANRDPDRGNVQRLLQQAALGIRSGWTPNPALRAQPPDPRADLPRASQTHGTRWRTGLPPGRSAIRQGSPARLRQPPRTHTSSISRTAAESPLREQPAGLQRHPNTV